MRANNIFTLFSVITIWIGVGCILSGIGTMNESGYVPPAVPAGWVMGVAWVTVGGVIAMTWFLYVLSELIEQCSLGQRRWTLVKIASISMVLFFAMGCAVVGTYNTWKHPYRIGECGCNATEWGPSCKPCQCVNGLCHSGMYGTGVCSCDFGWAGDKCNLCDNSHKPEGMCDMCKTGYAGEKCDRCEVGYTGVECNICDTGWQPWYHASQLFPETISEDDNRHLCDECKPNHFGFYCLSCPIGNDVPKISLEMNDPITTSSRATDSDGKAGYVHDVHKYDPKNPHVLKETSLKIQYDEDATISKWIPFQDIQGFQCNNRGTCMDDQRHQQLNPEWNTKCTSNTYEACNTNQDCKSSQNCKGTCTGTESPINSLWSIVTANQLCSNDNECRGPPISEDLNGNKLYYEGGRCVAKFCCDESYHGDGRCDCNPDYFGPKAEDGFKSHYELSPACDFCPGYDWITQETSTICSGGKGTCSPSYKSAPEAGVRGEYIQMRCDCGRTVHIDPETGIPDPKRVIQWMDSLCECGDWDKDGKCDICSSGHWGSQCGKCPGGAGSNTCSGHGTCDQGVNGRGYCSCDVGLSSSWMLAEYIPRYKGDCQDCNNEKTIANSDIALTCNECAPNFWGDQCLRCGYTDMIKQSELDDIFQPVGSFNLLDSAQSPHKVCHPEHPWLCTLACSGGGWCDWGRQGDGKCKCWSNKRKNEHTWNPLDNVCIGSDRYDPLSGVPYDGTDEQCPSYGYCKNGDKECMPGLFFTNKKKTMTINLEDAQNGDETGGWKPWWDWTNNTANFATKDEGEKYKNHEHLCEADNPCYKWEMISWRQSRSLITCQKEGN